MKRLLTKADRLAARFFPEGAERRTIPAADLEVGIYERAGTPFAFGVIGYFAGRAKPAFYNAFKSAEARDAFLAKKVEEFTSCAAYRQSQAAIRKAKMAQPNPLKVGDVLANSWGYDQTNVDYFEVVKVKGRMVRIREICREYEETGFMSGRSRPLPGKFAKDGKDLWKRVGPDGSINLYGGFGYLRVTDPAESHYESSYA